MARMDQSLYLDGSSNFTTIDVPAKPELLWGPVPLYHLSAEDMAEHRTVRFAENR